MFQVGALTTIRRDTHNIGSPHLASLGSLGPGQCGLQASSANFAEFIEFGRAAASDNFCKTGIVEIAKIVQFRICALLHNFCKNGMYGLGSLGYAAFCKLMHDTPCYTPSTHHAQRRCAPYRPLAAEVAGW